MGDQFVGLQARLMSQAMKTVGCGQQIQNGCYFHQSAPRKGWRHVWQSGNNTRRRALKFYSSVRLDVRRVETLKDNGEAVGNRTRVRVVKNKVAPPFKEAEFDIIYGHGISREGCVLDVGTSLILLRKTVHGSHMVIRGLVRAGRM